MYTHAIVRRPGRDLADGITTAKLGAPDYERALRQHACYVHALVETGVGILALDPLPGYPDAYFVEDVAVVLPEVAVITRPGAASRRGEEVAIAPVLARHRPILHIVPPGTMDGGDVLVVGQSVFVGISSRTNEAAAQQLSIMLEGLGYRVVPISVATGLHLKSSVCTVAENTLLVAHRARTGWSGEALSHLRTVSVADGEQDAANALFVNDRILMAAGFPETHRRLEALAVPIVELDVSEARKMDGGLTCMSIRF